MWLGINSRPFLKIPLAPFFSGGGGGGADKMLRFGMMGVTYLEGCPRIEAVARENGFETIFLII